MPSSRVYSSSRAAPPASPTLQTDAMLSQNTPNLMLGNVSQGLGHQSAVPSRAALWWGSVQLGQNAPFPFPIIGSWSARARSILKTGHPVGGKSLSPQTHRGRTRTQGLGDLAGLLFLRRCSRSDVCDQHDLCPPHHGLSSLGGSKQSLKLTPLFGRQFNGCSFHVPIIAYDRHFGNQVLAG